MGAKTELALDDGKEDNIIKDYRELNDKVDSVLDKITKKKSRAKKNKKIQT
jgi:hypothetical protein